MNFSRRPEHFKRWINSVKVSKKSNTGGKILPQPQCCSSSGCTQYRAMPMVVCSSIISVSSAVAGGSGLLTEIESHIYATCKIYTRSHSLIKLTSLDKWVSTSTSNSKDCWRLDSKGFYAPSHIHSSNN